MLGTGRLGLDAKGQGKRVAGVTAYCAARLQTLDQGAPVSVYTVARELGHGGDALVRRVYGHLGAVRHRSRAVEYRIEQHRKALRERLARLRAGALADAASA
ncbi:MAG: hypothetical protein WD773_12440 [Gemmatimonadales bacterium]